MGNFTLSANKPWKHNNMYQTTTLPVAYHGIPHLVQQKVPGFSWSFRPQSLEFLFQRPAKGEPGARLRRVWDKFAPSLGSPEASTRMRINAFKILNTAWIFFVSRAAGKQNAFSGHKQKEHVVPPRWRALPAGIGKTMRRPWKTEWSGSKKNSQLAFSY